MPALEDKRPIHEQWSTLMHDIMVCDNMILTDDEIDQNELDLVEEQEELKTSLEEMCQELGILEEVMQMKSRVDCDCFYA